MRHLWICLLALACAEAAEEPMLVADPTPVIAEVCADLDEAARLAGSGKRHDADAAWLRAHGAYDTTLEPWIRHHKGDRTALELSYAMGRLRLEMGERRGRPRDAAAALSKSLRALPLAPAATATAPGQSGA